MESIGKAAQDVPQDQEKEHIRTQRARIATLYEQLQAEK